MSDDLIKMELSTLAKNLGVELHYKETQCNNTEYIGQKVKMHKRDAWILLPNGLRIVWGFNPLSMDNNNMNISGIFFELPNIDKTLNINIRSKDFLDKLSIKRNPDLVRIDNFKFNSQFYITSNNPEFTHKFLSNTQSQYIITKILKAYKTFHIGINANIPKSFPDSISHMGIYSKQAWITDTNIIKELLQDTKKLKEIFG